MKIYLVGGAVRDKLLGLPVKERDWVVVHATAEAMLAQGYRQVGKEFPVFLHPKTHEEYALARMERKVDLGYKGFTFDTSPSVSLEEDLQRRDLTINAMAESDDGRLIDPFHGKDDLDKKLLRHVSPAFAEDPVRILRVGRFLARYAQLGFHVAPETIELMQTMVNAGEVNALVAERVWKELERALGEKNPEQFFMVLKACGALPILFPSLDPDGAGMQALQAAARMNAATVVRFAALLHDHAEIPALCNRYRVPNEFRDLAGLVGRFSLDLITSSTAVIAETLLSLFYSLDIFRRETRFQHFMEASDAIACARDLAFNKEVIQRCANSTKAVPVQEIIADGFTGQALAERLKAARLAAITTCLFAHKPG